MANVLVVVSFFFGLFVYIASNVEAVIGRALFCRDPDTGKLHPPNTTWPSTTFCGNYTCKIRKRNSTDTRHLEATELHVNESDKFQEHAPNTIDQLVEEPNTKNDETIDARNRYDKAYKIAQIEKAIKSGDRYLTEDEIKALSNLLHTVKKSDLEAIIDIYNLAQDIYNEMNRSAVDDIILTDQARLKNIPGNYQPDDIIDRKHSYWYEPLRNGMIKESTDTIPFIPTISSKVEHLTKRYPAFPNILSSQDFRQLPYYQPLPDYTSRLYNIYQQLNQKGQQTQVQSQLNQLNELPIRQVAPFQIITTPNYPDPFWVKRRASMQKLKLIQPSVQLGPGSLHAYRGNMPNIPKVFYYGLELQDKAIPPATPLPVQPIMQQLVPGPGPLPIPQQIPVANYGQSIRQTPTNEAPVTEPPVQAKGQLVPPRHRQYSYQKPLPKAVLENPYLHDDVRAFEQQQVIHPKRSNILQQLLRQEASSREIGTSIPNSIPELRTNVLEPQKPMMSQYRKLSLRKVGRLVNLKDLFRIKRQIDTKDMSSDEEFEAYVERKTCDLDMYPGFFRKGNESEVFPHCCPQRIQKR